MVTAMQFRQRLLGLFVATLAAASIVVASACSLNWDPLEIGIDEPDGANATPSEAEAKDGGTDADVTAAQDAACKVNAGCDGVGELCSFSGSCVGPGDMGPAAGRCVHAIDETCNAPPASPATPVIPGPQFCACDDRLHVSICEIVDAGLGLSTTCIVDASTYIPCGYAACPRASHFCVSYPSSHTFACKRWAEPCPTSERGCACAQLQACSERMGGTCDPDGGVTVSCP
jgi:hypothetical protein